MGGGNQSSVDDLVKLMRDVQGLNFDPSLRESNLIGTTTFTVKIDCFEIQNGTIIY